MRGNAHCRNGMQSWCFMASDCHAACSTAHDNALQYQRVGRRAFPERSPARRQTARARLAVIFELINQQTVANRPEPVPALGKVDVAVLRPGEHALVLPS